MIYQFTGDPDGWSPNGKVVFDLAGNLYGTTTNGGAYGQGTVYELTPSGGGWTEKVIYSFTGGSDGAQPSSLLLGQDGNLYGTTLNDYSGAGVIFQLVHSGDTWTEQILASFGGCGQFAGACYPLLLQEVSGNFYGLIQYSMYLNYNWYTLGQIFMMSPSQSGWQFTVLDDTINEYCYGQPWCYEPGYAVFWGLAIDAAGDLYGTSGTHEPAGSRGYVFKLLQPYQEQTLVGFGSDDLRDLELGVSGKVYGTTGACGGSKARSGNSPRSSNWVPLPSVLFLGEVFFQGQRISASAEIASDAPNSPWSSMTRRCSF